MLGYGWKLHTAAITVTSHENLGASYARYIDYLLNRLFNLQQQTMLYITDL